jgi:hypothetical protein
LIRIKSSLRLAAPSSPVEVCDWRKHRSCDKAVDKGFDDANQHSQRRPSKAGVELQPYLMQTATGHDDLKRKASEILGDEKRPQAEAVLERPKIKGMSVHCPSPIIRHAYR